MCLLCPIYRKSLNIPPEQVGIGINHPQTRKQEQSDLAVRVQYLVSRFMVIMHFNSISFCLGSIAFALTAIATPVPSKGQAGETQVPMKYTGPIKVNGQDVELYGNAQVRLSFQKSPS